MLGHMRLCCFWILVCPVNSWYFVHFRSRNGIYLTILDQISFNLQHYGELKLLSTILLVAILAALCFIGPYLSTEPATISIQPNRPALWSNDNTTLNCIADGAWLPFHQ